LHIQSLENISHHLQGVGHIVAAPLQAAQLVKSVKLNVTVSLLHKHPVVCWEVYM